MSKHLPFVLILLGYLLVGALYALYTPAWQAPDEPAHYNYVRQLADGRWPVMQTSDWSQAYQNEVISSRFAPRYALEPSFHYEDYQPPLYYLLQTPIFWLSDGRLTALRLFAVVLGGVTLWLVYQVAQIVLPERWQALTAVAFFAFLPQHLALTASVNNDSLSELLIAAMLWVLLRRDQPRPYLLGVLLGLAFLTKVTAYLMAPVIALLIWQRHAGRWSAVWRDSWRTFAPAFALGALWWGRNLLVYGWPDFLGIQAHDAVVVGQPQTAEWLAQYGWAYVGRAFVLTSFRSFWGQFGWMAVPMNNPWWIYPALALFSAIVIGGLLLQRPRLNHRSPIFIALTTLLTLSTGLYLAYNVTYVQHQGRYLFAALIPISVGVAWGLSGYCRWGWVERWRGLCPLGLAVGLIGLDLLALFGMIVPALSQG